MQNLVLTNMPTMPFPRTSLPALKKIIRTALCLASLCVYIDAASQAPLLPSEVKRVLQASGKNQKELQKAIDYFIGQKEPVKLQAVFFLIANMDIHFSINYIWVDGKGQKVPYDEMAFSTYTQALSAFNDVKKTTAGIHPQPVIYRDIDTIKSTLLIENVEEAFKKWKSPYARKLKFEEFCEYILPYRITIEPLQQWRAAYAKRFSYFSPYVNKLPLLSTLNKIGADYNKWFTNTYGKEVKKEPLPRLGAMQLLSRAKGDCENISDLETFMLRSQGIPVSSDFVPFWATSSGGHFFNAVYNQDGKTFLFDPMRIISKDYEEVQKIKLDREPGKVIRITYAKQPQVLIAKLSIHQIPDGFMRYANYKDVTNEYWEAKDIDVPLTKTGESTVAFANVFNYGKWQPVWWGGIEQKSVKFTQMSKGAVYLPTTYKNGVNKPAGYPIAVDYKSEIILKPDLQAKRRIQIQWQKDYLIFKPGKKYSLYYWDNDWKALGTQTAKDNANVLTFDNVPSNALLILIPEYSQHKERPFTIDNNGQRRWW